ncbi:glycosyl transferase [Bacillus pseudomycoides]|nr:glycosyl transferase [Bacillus pseudomycoides]
MNFKKQIIYVSHDANFQGAQLLSLNIVRALKENFKYDVAIICLEEGILLSEFQKYGSVYCLHGRDETSQLDELIKTLIYKGYDTAICSTVITGDIVELMAMNGIKVVSMVHELPWVIKHLSVEHRAHKIAQFSHKIVFPSQYVQEEFHSITPLDNNKCIILPQGLFNHNPYKNNILQAREQLRKKLNLPLESKIVLCVGFAEYRKGVDLFAQVASLVRTADSNIYFIWIGSKDVTFVDKIPDEHKVNVIFINPTDKIGLYNAGADLFLLTSREDPFPSAVLEAMDVRLPVIGFKDAGGFRDIVTDRTGELVDFLDVKQMSQKVLELMKDEDRRLQKGIESQKVIEENLDFISYIYELLALLDHKYSKVSVIVPNYNYGRYLIERIESIVNQTYPIYELIFLDDCSSDGSVEIFKNFLVKDNRKHFKIKTLINTANSGSVYRQWIKGISLADGDYIWIAEADDLCSQIFLEKAMKGFYKNKDVVLSYVQSKLIDEHGNVLAPDCLGFNNDISTEKWKIPYIRNGIDEIKDSLVVKNTIPNVSAVVFKKIDIREIQGKLEQYKVAGDWFFYTYILQKGMICFQPESLNYYRRHMNSIVATEDKHLHFNEVVDIQNYIISLYEIDPISIIKVHKHRLVLKAYLGI